MVGERARVRFLLCAGAALALAGCSGTTVRSDGSAPSSPGASASVASASPTSWDHPQVPDYFTPTPTPVSATASSPASPTTSPAAAQTSAPAQTPVSVPPASSTPLAATTSAAPAPSVQPTQPARPTKSAAPPADVPLERVAFSGPTKDPATGKPVVYLTIDDGPNPTWTPRVLKILSDNGATATFFMVGLEAERRPGLVAAVREQGSQVGNHTYGHVDLTQVGPKTFARQVPGADAVLGRTVCVRPPMGSTSATVHRRIVDSGRSEILWNVDTEDWRRPGTAAVTSSILGAEPGQVVLVHDGGGDRSQTVAALSVALPKIVARGWVVRAVPWCG